MSLLYWNFILNLVLYFELTLEGGYFTYVTFAYSIGNILSFMTGKLVFKKLKTKKALFMTISVTSVGFIGTMVLMEIISSVLAKKILIILLVAIFVYFGAHFQGSVSGFASICGPTSIAAFNVGTGVAGVGSNIIAIIFVFIFPTHDPNTQITKLHHQMVSYICFLILTFLAYLTTMHFFIRKFGHFVQAIDEPQKESLKNGDPLLDDSKSDVTKQTGKTNPKSFTTWKTVGSERKYSYFSILKRIIDMFLAMIFTYFVTIQVMCFMIPNLTLKFDNNSEIYLLVYFLIYNVGDTVGKLFPGDWNFKNSFWLHFATLVRSLIQVYFLFMIYSTPPKALSNCYLRGVIYLLVGITNGFFTNNYFCASADRFTNPKNKDFSGYLMVFSLIIGVTCGTLSGVLWNF